MSGPLRWVVALTLSLSTMGCPKDKEPRLYRVTSPSLDRPVYVWSTIVWDSQICGTLADGGYIKVTAPYTAVRVNPSVLEENR